MPILETALDAANDDFRRRMAEIEPLLAELRARVATARLGGGDEKNARHRARGKMLARERNNALLDPGGDFVEVGQLAAYGL